jgi:lipoate-protein ligase A
MHPLGGQVQLFPGDQADGASATSPEEDMERVRQLLTILNDGGTGSLRIFRPRPTAAFSPRDTTLPRYQAAAETMRSMGFRPVERRAGGLLAVYDETALVIDLVSHHPEPRLDVIERYSLFSNAIVVALQGLSVDARVGSVPGEYCPGDYSINGEGRIKLVGVAQRIGRRSYHLGAVISVVRSAAVMNAVATAYRTLELAFDQASFGAVADLAPELSFTELRAALVEALASRLVQPASTTASASISTS